MCPDSYGRYHHDVAFTLDAEVRRLLRNLLIVEVLMNLSESQGPDLNRSVVDLQSTAWPLRHLGDRVG